MEKGDVIEIVKQFVAFVLTAAVCGGLIAVGYYTADENVFPWSMTAISCFAAAAVCAAVNAVAFKKFTAHYDRMSERESYDFAQSEKDKVQRDYGAAQRRIGRTAAVSYIFAVLPLALILPYSVAYGRIIAGLEVSAAALFGVLFAVFFIAVYGVTYSLLLTPTVAPPSIEYVLSETDYPLFYATVRAAGAAIGCDYPVTLYDLTDGISVFVYKRHVYINLDYAEAALLTRDELFNVMLHEYSHVLNDVKRSAHYNRILTHFGIEYSRNPFVRMGERLFMTFYAARVQLAIGIFNTVSSRHFEKRADDAVKRFGSAAVYADAVAKISCFSQFSAMNKREIDYDFYAPEKPTKGFASAIVSLYREYFDKYAAKWTENMKKELPANVDSHPTARARLEAMGCTEADNDRKEPDPDYRAEQAKLLQSRDDYIYDRMCNEEGYYENYRKNAYLDRKAVMDEYMAAAAEGKQLSEPRMLTAFRAFYGVDDDTALEIVNRLTELDPVAPRANYYKGVLLSYRDDKACVENFKLAAKEAYIVSEAYEAIGAFALKTGDEPLLAEYRETVADAVQSAHDREDGEGFDFYTTFAAHGLDDPAAAELVEAINEVADGKIARIYVCKYPDGNGRTHYPVAVTLRPGLPEAAAQNLLTDINSRLRMYSDNYDLFLVDSSNAVIMDKFKYVTGALVYEAEQPEAR